MSVLKALSIHLSSTRQTAFHLEVGCKSNHSHKPDPRLAHLRLVSLPGMNLERTQTSHIKSELFFNVRTQRGVFASAATEVKTGESRKRQRRCGKSRGVISCLVYGNEAHLSLSTRCISPLCIPPHAHAWTHANAHSKLSHSDKILATLRGAQTACVRELPARTHGSHIRVRRQPGKQTELFAQLKVSQSRASQNLLWTLKAKPRTGRHTRTPARTHATWMEMIL